MGQVEDQRELLILDVIGSDGRKLSSEQIDVIGAFS